MKKTLYIFAGIIAFLLLAMYLVPLLYQKKIARIAKEEINKNTTANTNFHRVSISFFQDFPNLTVSFHNFSVVGKESFKGDTLASIEEVAIELKLWDLITKGKTDLKTIHLKKPVVGLVVLKNGHTNFDIFIHDTTATTDTAASSVNMAIDKVIVSDGKITYDDRQTPTYMSLSGFNYEGSGDFQKEIYDLSTKAEVKQLFLKSNDVTYLNNKEVEIISTVEVNTKENKYTIKNNSLRVNHFKLNLEGSTTLLSNGYDMDLRFSAPETEFKDILSLIPGVYKQDFDGIKTEGEILFEGFIKGKYIEDTINSQIPAFHLDMKVKEAMFKIDTLPKPISNIQMELIVDNAYNVLDSLVIDLKTFHLELDKHAIDGHIRLEGLNNYKIDAKIDADIELAELESMYPVKGLDLKGKIDFNLLAQGKYVQGKNSPIEIPTFNLDLKLANGKVKYDSLPAAIDDIQVHLLASNQSGNIEHTQLFLESIHMNMGGNPIHGYAKIEGFTKYLVDADIDAKLNLEDIEKMYPVEGMTMKGMFDLDLNAKGTYDPFGKKFPAVDTRMNLTNGSFQTAAYPEPVTDIHLISEAVNKTGNIADTKLTISNLTYSLEGEPFSVSGTIADFENYFYDLKIKGKVDLEKITKIYPVTDLSLTGIINTDIETKGSVADIEAGRYDKINSSGTVEIKKLKASGKQVPAPVIIYDAQFGFTPAKIVLKKMKGKLGKGHFDLTGDLYNYMSFVSPNADIIKGELKLLCDTLDLNPWLADSPPTSESDTLHSISLWEVPRNVDFVFDSFINVLKYEDMLISKMDGEITIRNSTISLKETGFNSLNASFNVSGDYNTQDLKHPYFDFDLDIKELDIAKAYKEIKLVRDLAPAMGNASGIFSVTYTLKGELDKTMSPKTETLVGGGEVRIGEAKINGMKIFEEISKAAKKKEINDPHLKDLVIKTEIKDNQLFVKPFDMNVSGFNTTIEGVNNIEGTIQYVVKLELLSIKVPFHITGTYDNPVVALGKGHTLPE